MKIALTRRVHWRFGIYRYGDALCLRAFHRSLEFTKQSKTSGMPQSSLVSLIEALTGTWLGFLGSWIITYCCNRWMTADPFWLSTVIVSLCTVWSMVRGYYVRRHFNGKLERKST